MIDKESNITETQSAIEAGMQLVEPNVFDIYGIPALLVPKNMTLHQFPDLLPNPPRITQKVGVNTATSFIDYFNDFATDDSVVFCDIDTATFVGVIDYHADQDTANWLGHTVTYTCKKTQEWGSWLAHNGKKMDQVEFAFFLEQNLEEIVFPSAAQMLEIALTLKANTKIKFESGLRLNDGQVQFMYREEMEGGAGVKGDIKIPETFTIGLRVFEGGEGFSMDARFRYRIADGKVHMWYDLVRPHKVHTTAVEDVLIRLKEQAKARLFLHGKP